MASGKALYSIAVVALGFICFVVGAIAVGLPTWGKFYSLENPNFDQGYFGPWRVCKKLLYNREKCGTDVSKFHPSTAVYIAGVVASVGVTVLGVFCVLSVLQLAMISSKERVALKYTHLVMLKLALALSATLLSIVAASLFAVQGDDRGFYVTQGEAFYVQIVSIVLNSILFIMSVYDTLFARRVGGDPTDPLGEPDGTTINNPGFKDTRGISMTDASGKPYSTNGHGSVASMNTTATTLTGASDASTITRSPLRSSLKKPRAQPPGLGIQNPGYSGHSPPLNRNGSQKKVRIQTHSTEV
ncbi:uncharacterized protein LOC113491839 isoform X2 [Trichoplusia ni]|uniref:Uncharacterized protein LOC113491839 isoform X2 n=1 Tax=Trichoplusia ni TaxID=7111 RepID=A0A7E5V942_TRINI|nr:uncharacterized protein LOC113491839 isoform X2 [Trichoplusia ni]